MKYIKNKILIVSLTLALCASTVFSVFYFLGVQNIPAAMVQDAMAPFQNALTRVSDAFDGYAIDDGKGDSAYAFARFLDEGGWIYQSVHNENYLKDGMRVYDYSTMKIVSPSKADAIYVSIDSWLPSNPSVISNDPIRLVLQDDGQWYLDSFTG
jgi:hypothetical protein